MTKPFERTKAFVPSLGAQLYVEVIYPHRPSTKAVIFAHGLRSYFTGFLNRFALEVARAGFIAVKFHFVGTGHSTGEFKDKLNSTMLQNYRDVVAWVAALPTVKKIGVMARSNAAELAMIHGPDERIGAYVFLGPPVFIAHEMDKYVQTKSADGRYFTHPSFKRPHTKGEPKLQLKFIEELREFEPILQRNVPKLKHVMVAQSNTDEAVLWSEGHFHFLEAHLPEPKQMVMIPNTTHSFAGHKREVIDRSIRWLAMQLR